MAAALLGLRGRLPARAWGVLPALWPRRTMLCSCSGQRALGAFLGAVCPGRGLMCPGWPVAVAGAPAGGLCQVVVGVPAAWGALWPAWMCGVACNAVIVAWLSAAPARLAGCLGLLWWWTTKASWIAGSAFGRCWQGLGLDAVRTSRLSGVALCLNVPPWGSAICCQAAAGRVLSGAGAWTVIPRQS